VLCCLGVEEVVAAAVVESLDVLLSCLGVEVAAAAAVLYRL